MLTRPRWLLHAEGAMIFAASLFFYAGSHFRWWLFAVLFLAPDLLMLGYLLNAKVGAAFYNLAPTTIGPICLLLCGTVFSVSMLYPLAVIWLAHLGFDRMLGYGLKYPTQLRDTHLQHV
jgi:Domain of unknown function (DUF4260)